MLKEYFNLVYEKIKNNDYDILIINQTIDPTLSKLDVYSETINYLCFEWMEDHNDNRRFELLDYVLKPNNSDFDFTTIDFPDFFEMLTEIKS